MALTYLIRTQPTQKQIESGKGLRGEIPDTKAHIFDEDKNNTYCNMYYGLVKSMAKRDTQSAFDDRWRLKVSDNIPSYKVCNRCLKRLWGNEYDRIKDANDVYTPKWI